MSTERTKILHSKTTTILTVARKNSLPTFVVLGAMKAGTTSLHYYLDQHPDVSMSNPKELNFFLAEEDDPSAGPRPDWNFYRGVEWYGRHFDADAVARGDVSPAYSNPILSGVAARMVRVLPNAQLIYITRDPLQRTLSHYQHDVARGRQAAPFSEVVNNLDSWYVQLSLYHKAMQPFLREFGEGRVVHYRQEDLSNRPDELLRDLFTRVGVRNDLPLDYTTTRLNIAGTWRRTTQWSPNHSQGKLASRMVMKARDALVPRASTHWVPKSAKPAPVDFEALDSSAFNKLVQADQELFRRDLESGRIVDGLLPKGEQTHP